MRSQRFSSNFGQPVYWSSGLCSCVAGEFAWYVLLWNLLSLGWCLVSVFVWKRLMSSCQLMFPGVRSSLVFSGCGLKPPASGFQSYFYSSLKILLLYFTIDKTSRLKMKSFSTVVDIQRDSLEHKPGYFVNHICTGLLKNY